MDVGSSQGLVVEGPSWGPSVLEGGPIARRSGPVASRAGARRRPGAMGTAVWQPAPGGSVPFLAKRAKGQPVAGGDELLLQDRAWRRRNSMWLLPTVVGCGAL